MLSAKSLYWATLGVFTLSLVSSHDLGIQKRLQEVANEVCIRTAPLRTMVELSWGRAHSDLDRVQGLQARIAAQQARLQAQQAGLQVFSQVQMQKVMGSRKVWKADRALRVERLLRENGIPSAIECPEAQINFEMPAISEDISSMSQDPI
jgi:hypothetical protein